MTDSDPKRTFPMSARPVKSAPRNGSVQPPARQNREYSVRNRTTVASQAPVCLNGQNPRLWGRVEEAEGLESGFAGAEAAGASGVDPVAVALALNGASREEADAFLRKQQALAEKQCSLIDMQKHHLHEQFKHLHLSVWEKKLGVLLRAATAIVGIVVAGFVGLMLWDAAHSSGLIIEPFAVPSDMAAKGLSGQVVASQMLDKLAMMQDATDSARPAQSYENDWGENLKVEIPETGISIGDLQNFLKGWLGHDTHITGEVWRTGTGIAVTARDGAQGGATFAGPESDLDGLMQKAAEDVYGVTQPYRYANFLDRNYNAPDIADRAARAAMIYRKLIAGPSALEQAWAWNGLGTIELRVKHDRAMAYVYYRKSVTPIPDFTMGYWALGSFELGFGRYEDALATSLKAKALLDRSNLSGVNPDQLPVRRLVNDGYIAVDKGDYGEAFRDFKAGAAAPQEIASLSRTSLLLNAVEALASLHDGGRLRGYMRDMGASSPEAAINSINLARGLEDWPTLLQLEKTTTADIRNRPFESAIFALAHAHLGDIGGAEALIAPSAADCDDCLIARGQIANLEARPARADYWFARVEKREPSIPFADAAWGQALLARGDADGAIAKFALANRKSPHFADALVWWGEALMAKNQSHLALAKFAEAEKYAPNWGRLHLKWGEALVYAGKKDEAKAQFARAAQLDLTSSEKAELTGSSARG